MFNMVSIQRFLISQGELSKFNYEEGLIENLGERQGTLKSSIRKLRQQVESFESK